MYFLINQMSNTNYIDIITAMEISFTIGKRYMTNTINNNLDIYNILA